MEKGTKEIGIMIAVVLFLMGMGVSWANGGLKVGSHRACGHPNENSVFNWLSRPRHCCYGSKLVADLRMLHLAQRMFHDDNQRNAAELNELLPYLGGSMRTNYYTLSYSTNAGQWAVSVDRTSYLPGYYLFCMDGKVHFDESRAATTNDLCLTQVKTE